MQKNKLLLLSLFLLGFTRTLRADNQFDSFGIKQAGKLLSNPTLFVYEFQRNMESTNPLPPGKRFGVNSHLLGGIIIIPLPDITSAFNLSGKVRLHPEGKLVPGLPQLDIVGGYWDSFLTTLVEQKGATANDTETKITRAKMGGSYAGLVLASSLEPRVRLFWGYKLSMLNIDIGLNRPETVLGNTVSSFKSELTEHTLSAGIEHTYGQDKRWILEGGYGIKNNLLSAKVSWYRKYVELGLNIYPESVFIMQPQFNIHFNF